jgi:hypothetical protein
VPGSSVVPAARRAPRPGASAWRRLLAAAGLAPERRRGGWRRPDAAAPPPLAGQPIEFLVAEWGNVYRGICVEARGELWFVAFGGLAFSRRMVAAWRLAAAARVVPRAGS